MGTGNEGGPRTEPAEQPTINFNIDHGCARLSSNIRIVANQVGVDLVKDPGAGPTSSP